MYERMLDKSHMPSDEEGEAYIGEDACELLFSLEKELKERYLLERKLVFPFGNHYGWMYYRVTKQEELQDVLRFIEIKKRPL